MLNFPAPSFRTHTHSLEEGIRCALVLGELSPGAEAHIRHLATTSKSHHDQRLLALLQDAIQDGCIRRVSPF
jgi:hypothetical protein